MASPKRIICVGHAALDRIYRIEAFPPEPTKVRALEHVEAGGGMSANAAVAIARLGGKSEFVEPHGRRCGWGCHSSRPAGRESRRALPHGLRGRAVVHVRHHCRRQGRAVDRGPARRRHSRRARVGCRWSVLPMSMRCLATCVGSKVFAPRSRGRAKPTSRRCSTRNWGRARRCRHSEAHRLRHLLTPFAARIRAGRHRRGPPEGRARAGAAARGCDARR